MAKRRLVELTLNGKPTDIVAVVNQLEIAKEDLLFDAASAIEDELNKFIRKVRNKTANRGRGPAADEYNDPLKGARASVTKKDSNTLIVDVDNRVFNILDAGSPTKRASEENPMKFPQYFGNVTRENELVTGPRVRVTEKPFWVTATEVEGFAPRNFYKAAAKKSTLTNYRKKRRERSIFRFPLDPKFITFKVVDGASS